MINVAICEDEKPQIDFLISLLRKWEQYQTHDQSNSFISANSKWRLMIDTFENAEQFLFSFEDKPNYDLLLLDIEMGEMNGMELARKIRQEGNDVKIVFLTGFKEFVFEGYEVGAIRYLLKPVKEDDLYKLMELICSDIEHKQKEYFLFDYKGKVHKIEFRDILYVEAFGHYVLLKTVNGVYEWKANFSSITQEFENHGFALIHRGIYINPEHILKIGRVECVMDNNEMLPISKNRYKEINQMFIAYYKEKYEG